jgi:hypothetical protein
MIGRLKPILNALGAEAHATYRAHYCGICVAARRAYGRRSTLGHSSELVLVSLLLDGLSPAAYRQTWAGCTVLPVLPRRVTAGPGRHAAAVAAGILAALQLDLEDARQDKERRIKQWLCRPLAKLGGAIDPQQARHAPWVREAIAALPEDHVGEIVAGVIGEVFRLAGFEAAIAAAGCRIGHALGRLMNLSDAVEDYFSDVKAGKANLLQSAGPPPDADVLRRQLHAILDELDHWIALLPLCRHAELIESLVNVHALARVEVLVRNFAARLGAGAVAAGPAGQSSPHGEPIQGAGRDPLQCGAGADCLSMERGYV